MISGLQLTYIEPESNGERTVSFGELRGQSVSTKFDTDKTPLLGVYGTQDENGFTSMGWVYYDIECKTVQEGSSLPAEAGGGTGSGGFSFSETGSQTGDSTKDVLDDENGDDGSGSSSNNTLVVSIIVVASVVLCGIAIGLLCA